MRFRVPKDAPPSLAKVADETLEVGAEIMRRERPSPEDRTRLASAAWLRLQICGAPAQRLEHSGKDGEPLTVVFKPIPEGDT